MSAPTPGSRWRHELLGTIATYRVDAVDGEHVHVTVEESPGLPVGSKFILAASAFDKMERLGESGR